jgi:hypothetical protein
MKVNGKAIIALVLVIVIAFGAIFLALRRDDALDNFLGNFFDKFSKDTTADTSKDTSKDTTSDTSNSGANTTTTVRYIDSDGYGYQTTAGVTAFFKTLKIPTEDKQYETDGKFSVLYEYPTVKAYGTFVLNVKWSTDGVLWNDFRYDLANSYPEGWMGGIYDKYNPLGKGDDVYGVDTTVYVSYTFVTNCVNPVEVLRDLKNNVFTVNDMFEPYLNYDKKPSDPSQGVG